MRQNHNFRGLKMTKKKRNISQAPVQRTDVTINQTPLLNNYTYLRWLAGLTLMRLVMIILDYRRNQPHIALSLQKAEKPSYIDTPSNFFPSAYAAKSFNQGIQTSWVKSIKFEIHSEFKTSNPRMNAENNRIFKEEIEFKKELLASLPLAPANIAALSKATIRLAPKNITPSGMVSFETGELLFGMIDFVSPAERRQTLLNEIHHLTVGYINKHNLKDNLKITGKQLYYPFLNEYGKFDANLKSELKSALQEVKQAVDDFDILLSKATRTPSEKKRLNTYLEVIDSYQPQVTRYELSQAEFNHKIASKNIRFTDNSKQKLELKLPDGNTAYGHIHIHDNYEDKVTILYARTTNENKSREVLGKAFIEDYRDKNTILTFIYPLIYRERGQKFDENDLLREKASDIDELLTPEMKQVFAPKFKQYFDAYNELGLEIDANNIYRFA